MKTISLHVPEDAYADLKAAAARRGQPVAQVIREAMLAWLESDRRSERHFADVRPYDSGPQLTAWDRADLFDEMLER